jgi:hypothetical protein
MAVLTDISPVLLVADLQRSVDYFRDGLGFECHVSGNLRISLPPRGTQRSS